MNKPTAKASPKLSGGPLGLSPAIAELFLAQIAATCGDDKAVRRVKRIVKGLSKEQRGYAAVIGWAVKRRCGLA